MASPNHLTNDLLRDSARIMDASYRASSRSSFSTSSRRHSARIEKPRSHNPSPRTPERRRTFNAIKHYSSLEDHYRRMTGQEDQPDGSVHYLQPAMRPVSWHPGTTSYQPSPSGYAFDNFANVSPTGHYVSYQNSPIHPHYQMPIEPTWDQYMRGEVSTSATPVAQHATSWLNNTQSSWEAELSNASNDQGEAKRDVREPSEELVGIGLYDEPGFTVKIGSKLEEECEAPEAMQPADADDESSEDEDEELPPPEEAKVNQTTLPYNMNMSGQSFFLGAEEILTPTWWSEQQKQPEPQVQALNYGWVR